VLRPRIIPCLLIDQGRLVKTKMFKEPIYLGDPINVAKVFNEKKVDEIVLLDISATKLKKGPDFALLEEFASECFMPVSYGGGITKLEEIEKLFYLGFEKVILNTTAFTNPSLITEAVKVFGSQSIVASMDVKRTSMLSNKLTVFVRNGDVNTNYNPKQYLESLVKLGVGEIIINSISREGAYVGYNLDLIRELCHATQIPIIALGGARNLEDMKQVLLAGASGAAAGSIFVFHQEREGVLISYPKESEIENLLSVKTN
jgi:imidazole glycerol-phosphate synthase subunit HisF